MAPTSIHDSIHHHHYLLLLLLLLLQPTTSTTATRGLTVELIHRYSERSPFHDGNLTQSQLLQRLVESSRSRLRWMESTSNGANITSVRPLLEVDRLLYLVPVRIGTSRGMRPYHLLFDTGSILTWTQCEPCEPCFNQRNPRFDPSHSPSYRPLPNTDPLCIEPGGHGSGPCTFHVGYADDSFAEGVLSKDTFTFQSDTRGRYESVDGVVFGCAHSADVQEAARNRIDGIMGFAVSPLSLPMLLRRIVDGHFSYCLVPPGTGNAGFLRLGRNHAHPSGALAATPILPFSTLGHYHLHLEGISINGERLALPPGTFARHGELHGGCIIDTGFPMSVLIDAAYDEVSDVLSRHFQALHRVEGRDPEHENLELCYRTPRNYARHLPHMTLHLQSADYHIDNRKLFVIDDANGLFCWAMLPSEQFTIIGAHQQSNTRFSYDIHSRMLSFGPENCAAGSHS